MSRAKPPKEIVDRRKEQPKEGRLVKQPKHSLRTRFLQFWNFGGNFLTVLLACLGFVTGYLSLIPRLSVSQNQPLDVNNPFSAPFVVSNDGPLDINKVQFSCVLLNIEFVGGGHFRGTQTTMFLGTDRMEPGERATVPCDTMPIDMTGAPFASADVAVKVSFRPDFTWWRKPREFRFVTQHGSGGQLYWYPQPLNGPVSSPIKGYPPK